jgi:hypothetical protein
MTAPASAPVAGVGRIGVYEAICEWIRNDVGLGVQMGLTPDATKKLVARIEALASPVSGDGSLQAEDRPSVPTCSPEFARLVLPSLYMAFDCIVSETGGIAQERLEYVITEMERAREQLPRNIPNRPRNQPVVLPDKMSDSSWAKAIVPMETEMIFRISTQPTFEVGDKTFGGEMVRLNDGSLIVRNDEDDDEAPNLRVIIPRVVPTKRGDPYDKPDPEQEAFAARIVSLLNKDKDDS